MANILNCMDSRTSAELFFDKGLVDIFSIRLAGNVLNDNMLDSMEFDTKVVGTKIILLFDHTKCGAVEGAYNQVDGQTHTAFSKNTTCYRRRKRNH